MPRRYPPSNPKIGAQGHQNHEKSTSGITFWVFPTDGQSDGQGEPGGGGPFGTILTILGPFWTPFWPFWDLFGHPGVGFSSFWCPWTPIFVILERFLGFGRRFLGFGHRFGHSGQGFGHSGTLLDTILVILTRKTPKICPGGVKIWSKVGKIQKNGHSLRI